MGIKIIWGKNMKKNRIFIIFFIFSSLFIPFQLIFLRDINPNTSNSLDIRKLYTQANDSSDSVGDEWRMFGKYLNNTRFTMTTPERGANYFWRYGSTDITELASPAIADGRVFCAGEFEINCYNATTGQFLWDYSDQSPVILDSPAVANGCVYFSHYDYIYCVNITDGSHVWHTDINAYYYSSPAVVGGRVYIGGYNITCLDASNGTIIWTKKTGGNIYASPTIVNGKLFIGSRDNQMYCFDAATGTKIWNYTVQDDITSTAAVANGYVYFGSRDHFVYCLNELSGTQIWNYSTNNYVTSSPAVAYGRVYIGSYDKNIYCLNATNGNKLWNYTTGGYIRSSPTVANGFVYFGGDDQYFYCLNATLGNIIWKYFVNMKISSSPSIANGRIYIATEGRGLYCLPMIFDYPPTIQLLSPTNGSTVPPGKILSFNISDDVGLNSTWYNLNGAENIPLSVPYHINTSSWSSGRYIVSVNANDSYGFSTKMTYIFKIGSPTVLFEDVELGVNGWNTSGTPTSNETYGWHITTKNSYSPTHAWWCADNSTGQTGNNWNISLISPLINLTSAYTVNLTFYHKYGINQGSDYGYVEININGTSNWTPLKSFTGTQSTWIQENYNLTSFKGEYVYIRFRFESDYSGTSSGWYIDDICVDVRENLNMPILSNAEVSPPHGNSWLPFTFWINYTDLDDNPPTYVEITIDEIQHQMEKQDPSDFCYMDGCLYKYSTLLTNTTHNYYFNASDGIYTIGNPTSGSYSGPIVDLYLPRGPPIEDWYRSWGGADIEMGLGVAVDSKNNSYLVGYGETFSVGGWDAYLAKYDSDGNQLWNETWGGANSDWFWDVAVDLDENIYVVGETSSFGSGKQALIVKYNVTGQQIWNRTYGTVNSDAAYGVTIGKDNSILVVGETNPSGMHAFLLKYDEDGNLLNNTVWIDTGSQAYDVVVDNDNNTLIVGVTTDGFFGNQVFLAKFDANCNLLKNQTWGWFYDDKAFGIDIDTHNNIFIAGTTDELTSETAFILKYNSSCEFEWACNWGGNDEDWGYDVGADNEGNCYLLGYTNSFTTGGSDYDVFLVKYDKYGNQIWNRTWGTTGYETARSLAIGQYNDYYIGGTIIVGPTWWDGLILKLYWPNPPAPPTLGTISPDPNHNGFILLNWTTMEETSIYYIYRDTQPIVDVADLTPIAGITTNRSQDLVLANGTYYYVVVAGNVGGNSTPSNRENVTIDLFPSLLDWNQTWGGAAEDYGNDIAVDSNGNAYLTGHTYSYGAGSYDVFLTKFSSTGNLIWNVTWGGSSGDKGQAVTISKDNFIYITGETLSFDLGGRDAILVKYDSTNEQIWNRTWGTTNREYGNGIFVDNYNYAYICGTTLTVGPNDWDAFLVKYDSEGNQIWNVTWSGSESDWGYGVAVDNNNYSYLVGYTYSFGEGERDGFLAKYDSEKNQIWNRTWGGSGLDDWTGIAMDSGNNLYLTGFTNSFGLGGRDFVIAKYDSDGNQLWNQIWGGTKDDYSYDIVVDSNNCCYVIGTSESYTIGEEDVVLLKYDSEGNLLHIRHWGDAQQDVGLGVDLDSADNCYIGGYTQTPGESDYQSFIARYATGGTLPENHKPILDNGSVTPSMDREHIEFLFEVNYTDIDNEPPSLIQVYINGTVHEMNKRGADSDYIDGCIYEYKTLLSPGSYNYYFFASDSEDSARLPLANNFSGPTVFPNQVPQLSNPELTPISGNNLTVFTFYVNYSDADNDTPQNVTLIIEGVGIFAMNKHNKTDSNYIDGCIYNYSLSLDVGNYTHYFNASDGYDSARLPLSNSFIGPNVSIVLNYAPELLNGSVSPLSGNTSILFTFKVTYLDADNDTPTEIYVFLDDIPYEMVKFNPVDNNFTDGVDYIYNTTLSIGSHTYYFSTSDGIHFDRFPADGTINGPTIQDGGEKPTDFLWIVIIIGISAAIGIGSVLIIYRRRNQVVKPLIIKEKPAWVSKALSYTPELEQKILELIKDPRIPKKIKDPELLELLKGPFTAIPFSIIEEIDKMPYPENEKIEILKNLLVLPSDQRERLLLELLDNQQREESS